MQTKIDPEGNFHAGLRFVAVMKHLDKSQTEMAEYLEVTQTTISKWTNMESFSSSITKKTKKLKNLGINNGYFKYKSDPMKLEVQKDEYDLITQLKKENKKLVEKMVELESDLNTCKSRSSYLEKQIKALKKDAQE